MQCVSRVARSTSSALLRPASYRAFSGGNSALGWSKFPNKSLKWPFNGMIVTQEQVENSPYLLDITTTNDHHHVKDGATYQLLGGQRACPYDFTAHDIDEQYEAHENGVVLFDSTMMISTELVGKDAGDVMASLMPKDVRNWKIGQNEYFVSAKANGALMDYGCVFRLGEERFLTTSGNGGNLPHFMLQATRGKDCTMQYSDQCIIFVSGKKWMEAVARVLDHDIDSLPMFLMTPATLKNGKKVQVSKVNLGMEFMSTPDVITALYGEIRPHAVPAGLRFLERYRLECNDFFYHIFPRTFHEDITFWECGTGWMVNKAKHEFLGKAAIMAQKGKERVLMKGLVMPKGSSVPPVGAEILNHAGELIGHISVAEYSPKFGRPLAWAYVLPHIEVGSDVRVQSLGQTGPHTDAVVTRAPIHWPIEPKK